MKTAMQELIEWLKDENAKESLDCKVLDLLGKEKEQLKTAFNDGASWELYGSNITHEERANKYFNEIFFK